MGAVNVAGGVRGGLATVSLEQVLVWNPEVIITIDQDFAAIVRNDPSWAAVSAVREGRVHLSPKMPFGWVDFPPAVNRLPACGGWGRSSTHAFPGRSHRHHTGFLRPLLPSRAG